MSIGELIRYQGWYNIYEGKKVSRVTMCEVRSREKQPRTNPKFFYNDQQWKEMDCDEPHLM
jgi:hypothetical protein